MDLCKDCKHWSLEAMSSSPAGAADWSSEPYFGASQLPVGFRPCQSPHVRSHNGARPSLAADAVYLDRDYALRAGDFCHETLTTGPEFGCIHWEPRTPAVT